MADRCPDCGYSVNMHFRSGDGRYTGCPWSPLQDATSRVPRVTLRLAIRGPHKGHVIVGWADCVDAGEIWLSDLDTGDQWLANLREHQVATRRLRGSDLDRARERAQDQAGGPVRVITRTTEAKRTA